MNNKIIIEEQGLRDGLQTLSQTFSIETKLRWIENLVNAGLKRIQIASFVNPQKVPQMADAEALFRQVPAYKDVILSALVLNKRGVERAVEVGVKHLAVSLSASNTHSIKNTGMSIEEAKNSFKEMVNLASENNIKIRGGIQCAFGCRYEGEIKQNTVLDLIKHHLDLGLTEIALADSTGMGVPTQVAEMMQKAIELAENKATFSLHLHNTENMGYANVFAALQVGIRQFDTAFGGLGGCPFIKNATGNIATEDTVQALEKMGFETNIDIKKVAEISKEIESEIKKPLAGLVYKLI
jgi:hydroxymethylglutaryl-CoA lyase